MIIVRTPFRISFTGGGSDLRPYYQSRPGAVVSAALTRYMHVTISRRFDDSVRLAYTRTEIVPSSRYLRHDLAREALKQAGLHNGVEITTVADVPAGTGLGSSSSLAVGLVHALGAYQGRFRSPEQLAREACRIEIDILGRTIGKQDQYAAAYGGFNYIQFNPDESVFVQPILCSIETKRKLQERLAMFYIAARTDDSRVLEEQHERTLSDASARSILGEMVDIAQGTRDALQCDDLDGFGELLHRNWDLKRQLHPGISTESIDRWYAAARDAGAMGGKILGAGGAGFLLVFCKDGAQTDVKAALESQGLRHFPIRFEPEGSKVFLISDGEV